MTFELGSLLVEINEELETVAIWRRGDNGALMLAAEEMAWLMWGPGSTAVARLRHLEREKGREPAAAARELAIKDRSDVPDGQLTISEH
jgi:hypothetical protein